MSEILKCKICGGDLETTEKDVATCLYCGTKQMLPKMTSERKANLYDRAGHYRSQNEFDKALAIYEQILAEDDSDADVYWDIVLCRYGIEYVVDPKSQKRIPTVNRAQFKSIFEDKDYLSALKHASEEQKSVLKIDAETIDKIQQGILEISKKEEPYDIFICYKETDNSGRRTPDSVIAQDIYSELSKQGYKIFFSRITLEDKIGSAYEPYIFAALNSAKIMLVVGTNKDNFDAVWVKNEWSRYLSLIKAGEKKTLIPAYRDMDPYDLPEEFSHLQAQDMSKLGFMQDLLRGISKIMGSLAITAEPTGEKNDNNELKKKVIILLDAGEFDKAKELCDKALYNNPDDAETYLYRLCAELNVKRREDLGKVKKSFESAGSYSNAIKFASKDIKDELEKYVQSVKENEKAAKKNKKKLAIIATAIGVLVLVGIIIGIRNHTNSEIAQVKTYAENGDFESAKNLMKSISSISSSNPQLSQYVDAGVALNNGEYESAKEIFESLGEYMNAQALVATCEYYILENELQPSGATIALTRLEGLLSKGVEDKDDLTSKIYAMLLSDHYNNKEYSKAVDDLYEWHKKNKDACNKYKEENQATWYDDALKMVDDGDDLSDIQEVFALCDDDYKDVETYREILSSHNYNDLFDYVGNYPVAERKLWENYYSWLDGSWHTADGKFYFTYDSSTDDGHTTYNLPWFDMENSYYEIDGKGIYFLHKQDDETMKETRKDMYDFDIMNKNQLKVHCYKDNSDYIIYRD